MAVVREHKFGAILVFLAISIVVSLVARQIWDTMELRHLLPHHFMWTFVIGSLIWFAVSGDDHRQRMRRKVIASAALLLAVVIQYEIISFNNEVSRMSWLAIGGLSLIWLGPIKMPSPIALFLSLIGQASFYIYILHPVFGYFPRYVFEWEGEVYFFLIGLGGSLAAYLIAVSALRNRGFFASPAGAV